MVLMVASLLSPSLATAADPVLPAGSGVDFAAFGGVMLKLALVLGLIFAASWAVRRFQGLQRNASRNLEVVDILPIGPKERILVVRAGNTQLLVAQTPGRLATLHELSEPLGFAEHVARQLDEKHP